jgi:hypothetical protein
VANPSPTPSWHNGFTFEASDEHFQIEAGERSIAPQLTGYTAPPAGEVSTPCPDITPIRMPRLDNLPAGYRVLLRVARAEDLKAFHLYKRIPDFAQGDGPETAIWGAITSPPPHGWPAAP